MRFLIADQTPVFSFDTDDSIHLLRRSPSVGAGTRPNPRRPVAHLTVGTPLCGGICLASGRGCTVPRALAIPKRTFRGICLAACGERSGHFLINTSLQRGACFVSRQRNRFSGFSSAAKTAETVSDACVGVFPTPLKQRVNDTHSSGR
jgi:hypothetical protein